MFPLVVEPNVLRRTELNKQTETWMYWEAEESLTEIKSYAYQQATEKVNLNVMQLQ